MELKRFSIAIFMALAFLSCNDGNRQNNANELDAGTDTLENNLEENALGENELEDDFVAVVEQNPDLSQFYENLERNQLAQPLADVQEPMTVFIPANTAYDSLPQEQRDNMMNEENLEKNQATVLYMMVPGEITTDELRQEINNANGEYSMSTMQGEEITAIMDDDTILLTDANGNTATIIDADVQAGEAVIHVVDGILMPSDPTQNEATLLNGNTQEADTTATM